MNYKNAPIQSIETNLNVVLKLKPVLCYSRDDVPIYGIEIWSCASPSLINKLFIKQKMAIRIISNVKSNSHTEPLFKALSILPLSDLSTLFQLKFFFSFIHNLLPSAFSNSWVTTLEQRLNDGQINLLYILRNNDEYYVPLTNYSFLSRFPLFNLPSLWNNLPPPTKAITSKNLFISTIKQNFLSQLNSVPNCTRLICPACIQARVQS